MIDLAELRQMAAENPDTFALTNGDVLDIVEAALRASEPTAQGWRPISEAPHAQHVMAARFDDSWGEWIYAVVLSPPSTPFTHWCFLPPPPADGGEHVG